MILRVCSRCRQEPARADVMRWQSYCRKCNAEVTREWRAKQRERWRAIEATQQERAR
jgi:transcription initiation factor TFIIIB Brf1 subunit/transcription initiation factor TFIIB